MVMERGECPKSATKVSEDDATNYDDVKRRMKPQLSSASMANY